eukprot:TRINITY_DN8598_c0_g1_i1.p1 TRINITY_DN8598_c0_g1~~TRINITY_DN8598_c0_g1_i1.p1  ORF type:complete len:385 (+),score=38.72 TRINITY_DN8598_c0_g1_i1:169-1323(+)
MAGMPRPRVFGQFSSTLLSAPHPSLFGRLVSVNRARQSPSLRGWYSSNLSSTLRTYSMRARPLYDSNTFSSVGNSTHASSRIIAKSFGAWTPQRAYSHFTNRAEGVRVHARRPLFSSSLWHRLGNESHRAGRPGGNVSRTGKQEGGGGGGSGGARAKLRNKNMKLLQNVIGVIVVTLGMSYASVPLYRLFCQQYGYGGTVQTATSSTSNADGKKKSVASLKNSKKGTHNQQRKFNVIFNADVNSHMPWEFTPLQTHVECVPGESVLAFFNAKNTSDKPIIGVSTYNVTPFKAGLYFNKIQCFCFEEQKLQPHEDVDMPVFFFLDPEIVDDKELDGVSVLTLSYTFFKVEEEEDVGEAIAALSAENAALQEEQRIREEKEEKALA